MPPQPPRNRDSRRPQTGEKKGNPLGKIIGFLVVIVIIGAAVMVAIKIPPTVELEKQMDSTAETLTLDSVSILGDAIEKNAKAVNRKQALQLGNEAIALLVSDAVAVTDYRTLEKIEEELAGNTRLKLFDTAENKKVLADGWQKLLDQMQKELTEMEEVKLTAEAILATPVPSVENIRKLAAFKLPPGFAAEGSRLGNAAYAAAIVIRNQSLADSFQEAAGSEDIRTGTEETCKDCSGKGTVTCQNCVRNPGKCPACSGKGTISGSTGTGRTFATTEIKCNRCDGSGICTTCKGTGNRECFHCKGSGKRPNSDLARQTMKDVLETLISRIDVRSAEFGRLQQKHSTK